MALNTFSHLEEAVESGLFSNYRETCVLAPLKIVLRHANWVIRENESVGWAGEGPQLHGGTGVFHATLLVIIEATETSRPGSCRTENLLERNGRYVTWKPGQGCSFGPQGWSVV